MTGLSLLLVAAATGVDFGWQPQPDGHLEYVIQIAPSQVELLKSGQIVINDIPPDVRGGRSFVLKVGAGDVPRQGRTVNAGSGAGIGQGAGLVGRSTGPASGRQAPRFAPIPGPIAQPEPNAAANPPALLAQPAGAQAPIQPALNPAQPGGVAAAPALLPANPVAAAPQPQVNETLRAPELAVPIGPQNAPLQPIPAQPNPQFIQPAPQFAQPNPQFVQPAPALQPQPGSVLFPNAGQGVQPNVGQPNLAQPNLAQPNFQQPNFGNPPLAQPAAPPAAAPDPRWNDPRAAAPEFPAVVTRPGDQVPAAGPWPQFPQGAPPRDDSSLLVPVGPNGLAAGPTRPPQVDIRGQPWEPVAQDPRLNQQPGIGPDPRFDPIQPRIDPWQRRWDSPPADDNFNGPVRNDNVARMDADGRWANARWDGSRWTTPRGSRSDNPIRDTSFRSRNPNTTAVNRDIPTRGNWPEDTDRFAGDPNDRWQNDPNDRWQNDPNDRFNTIPVGYAPAPASGLGLGAIDALRVDRNGTGTMLSTGKTPVSSTPSKALNAAALDARDQSWMPWTITTLGLFLSIGANLYLWWIWSDAHRRYMMLIAEMRSARS